MTPECLEIVCGVCASSVVLSACLSSPQQRSLKLQWGSVTLCCDPANEATAGTQRLATAVVIVPFRNRSIVKQ